MPDHRSVVSNVCRSSGHLATHTHNTRHATHGGAICTMQLLSSNPLCLMFLFLFILIEPEKRLPHLSKAAGAQMNGHFTRATESLNEWGLPFCPHLGEAVGTIRCFEM